MENENSCEFKLKLLQQENENLRETIAIALNKPILIELKEAISEIERGEGISEKDFANKFNLAYP